MNSRSYAVIGLGQFGMTVALTLADAGCDVLVVRTDLENKVPAKDHTKA